LTAASDSQGGRKVQLSRQAAEIVELCGAEPGHERHSSSEGGVELAYSSFDTGIELVAMGSDVLAYGSIDDALRRTAQEVSCLRHEFVSGGVDFDRRSSGHSVALHLGYQGTTFYHPSQRRSPVAIDRQFADAGWPVQDSTSLDLFAA